jgi:formimidoylglutamate deiminase
MTKISARQALTANGWARAVIVTIDGAGVISNISEGEGGSADHSVGVLLPALSNVHSHSFQRAMAGLAEARGGKALNNFWTWRQVMYRFLEILTPEDIGVIAAQVQMEMLEAGYGSHAEFHYLHHAPGGAHYDTIDELSLRHIEAAQLTGIGYTHLPVLYMQGGLDGRALKGGQVRFGCSIDDFEKLHAAISERFRDITPDFTLGVAPHSLRAVSIPGLRACLDIAQSGPFHIHAAEQTGEVEEVIAALHARPVQWLLDNMPVGERWCFIHATHLDHDETDRLAQSGAVAGLCPITEGNLGDGVFNASRYTAQGGAFGIGSDSNVIIALTEELRMLEVSQRLRDQRRLVLTDEAIPSNGRFMYERAARGGAQAIGRNAGRIEIGALADFVALDDNHHAISGLSADLILDAWIFASSNGAISDVWAAGRHVVSDGVHKKRAQIAPAFRATVKRLRESL